MTDSSVSNSPDFSKRYWLFGYPEYEAGGGMNDFISSHDDIEDAQQYSESLRSERAIDYMQIFDSQERQEVRYWNYYHGWYDA